MTRFNRRAGDIGIDLEIAGIDDACAFDFDQDLHRAEHMTGRKQLDGGVAKFDAAVHRERACRDLREAAAVHENRLCSRYNTRVLARMIGMGVRNETAVAATMGVEEEFEAFDLDTVVVFYQRGH